MDREKVKATKSLVSKLSYIWKQISVSCVQADLPKSEHNFVKETFECGKRLAKNKVPQFVSSLMSHSFIIVIIIIITRSSLSSMICRCMSSTPCQQSSSFSELWASELSCQSILNITSGNQHPVRVKQTFQNLFRILLLIFCIFFDIWGEEMHLDQTFCFRFLNVSFQNWKFMQKSSC